MYNPEKGYIVSANNLVAGVNARHGVTHAFSFTHRFIRLNELFDQRIKDKGYLDVQDMIDGQLDTVDLQAQVSTKYIIKNVEKGIESALNILYKENEAKKAQMRRQMKRAFDMWNDWNFGFEIDQI
jgi:acyl-homoserine lactone acylase PvdQ